MNKSHCGGLTLLAKILGQIQSSLGKSAASLYLISDSPKSPDYTRHDSISFYQCILFQNKYDFILFSAFLQKHIKNCASIHRSNSNYVELSLYRLPTKSEGKESSLKIKIDFFSSQ